MSRRLLLWVMGLLAMGWISGPALLAADDLSSATMRARWHFSARADADAPMPAPVPTSGPTRIAAAPSVEGAPTIAAGTVFFADGSGALHALDLATGKEKWAYRIDDGFETSPLVSHGTVYLGDLSGIFHAVDAGSGKKLWTFDAQNTIHSSASIADGNIVFGTDGADLFCLSPQGKQIWQAKADDRINGAPTYSRGVVYVSGCDSQLRAFSATTGEQKFASELGALAPGSPVVLNDRILIGTDEGHLLCMPPNGGKPIWNFSAIEDHAMVYGTPAVSGDIAVFGARDRRVYAIDVTSGNEIWKCATRGDVDASPVINGGRVYVGSRDKHLYVLDLKTGRQLWTFPTGRPIAAGVAIGDGVLVLADSGGNVYCLEPDKK